MSDKTTSLSEPMANSPVRSSAIDASGWAVLFIWIGVSLLAHLSWGWFLVGVGVLALATQFARWRMGRTVEVFGLAGAVVFLAAGAWMILELDWPLAPVLLILLGVVLLGNVLVSGLRRNRQRGGSA